MLSYLRAYASLEHYKTLGYAARKTLRQARLKALLVYAQKNSPFYEKHLKSAGLDLSGTKRLSSDDGLLLSWIPRTNRKELATDFDQWVTDRRIKEADLAAFTADLSNLGKLYLNKYMVFKTSGTTDTPLTALYDKQALAVFDAINASIRFARKDDFAPFLNSRRRTACVYVNEGFHMGNGLTLRKQPARFFTGLTRKILVDAASPISEIVDLLNRFRPDLISSFPTTLELLADERKAGRLWVTPALLAASGENLSEASREYLREVFGCFVKSGYVSTEGGIIASECALGRYHLNDDWVIVEPVDSSGKPVPNGQFSDKLLLTNLSNYVQPFIRYESTDRVALHSEDPCPCGNPSPWIEIDGRFDAVTYFDTPKGKKKVAPLLFQACLMKIAEIRRYQVIVRSGNVVELRLEAKDRRAVFGQAAELLRQNLKEHGIKASVKLSGDLPRMSASGKFQLVINERADKDPVYEALC